MKRKCVHCGTEVITEALRNDEGDIDRCPKCNDEVETVCKPNKKSCPTREQARKIRYFEKEMEE
jgi:hypothetical protein